MSRHNFFFLFDIAFKSNLNIKTMDFKLDEITQKSSLYTSLSKLKCINIESDHGCHPRQPGLLHCLSGMHNWNAKYISAFQK